MKTLVSLFLSTLLTVFLFQNVHSQSTTAGPGALGHTGAAVGTDWCGWNAGVPIPFNLEHRGTLDMNFLTGGIQRMTVKGTAAGATIGFVGIGLTAPVSLLHVNSTATGELFRTQGPAASVNSWRMISGTTERGKLFVLASSNDFNIQASTAAHLYSAQAVAVAPALNACAYKTSVAGCS
jgi:hypothetical protein